MTYRLPEPVGLAEPTQALSLAKDLLSDGRRYSAEQMQATYDAGLAEGRKVLGEFLRGFNRLAHNYSLRAIPPDYYSGTEGDAFSAAYKRCGKDLADLRAMLEAEPELKP